MSYSYSTNEEIFYGEFDTIQDALDEVKENYGDDYQEVYIGENGVFKPFVDGEDVIERVQEQAFEEMGDSSEIYLVGIKQEHMQELSEILTKAFDEWSTKYGYEPNCYPVNNVKKYTVGEGTTK